MKSNESGTTPNESSSDTNTTSSRDTFQQQTNIQDEQMTEDLYTEILKSNDMTNTQKIQSEIDELHKKFDVLQSQSATLSELNSVRRELNVAYEKLRKN